ncbi:M20 family metallopeptidase [Aquimarina hainanensis]|uniref:M20 family metallopeptidase n=1 Tax=Aquimarina hainanensis TaxID=1578017 RepID=A0ABW5N4T7_9FLAO
MILSKTLRNFVVTIQFLFLGVLSFGQHIATPPSIHNQIQEKTDVIFEQLVNIRNDFYTHPEPSGNEKRTSQKIAEHLQSLGLEVKTDIGGHGVVGILSTGKKGKHISWRADIDALPAHIHEKTGHPSTNKKASHVCGHDVNTTVALGIANVLTSIKSQLTGTISFIFQPAEETYKGAKAMIDDGLFELISPDEIYGAHLAPMETTMIATKPEWLFADYKTIKVSFRNSEENDAIIAFSKKIISTLQNVAPDDKFWNPKSISDPTIGLANPNTIFTNYRFVNPKSFEVTKTDKVISIEAYIGASDATLLTNAIQEVTSKIRTSKFAKHLIDVSFSYERATVNNDTLLTQKSLASIAQRYGAENIIRLYGEMPDYRGDDFAYFQQHVPGVYFYLGGSNFAKGIISMPHIPSFSVDLNCIRTGVNYFSSMIIDRLAE